MEQSSLGTTYLGTHVLIVTCAEIAHMQCYGGPNVETGYISVIFDEL